MFSFTTPEASWDEHEYLVSVEEEIIGNLELPYRVVNIAAGDLGGQRREEVRHRGVAARPGSLPRAHVVLEHDRLSGAAPADARAAGRRVARDPAHPERHGDGDRPHAHRPAREPPAGGRLGGDAGEAASVPARAGARAPSSSVTTSSVSSKVTPFHTCRPVGSDRSARARRGAGGPSRRGDRRGTLPRPDRRSARIRSTSRRDPGSSGWTMRAKCLGSAISSSGV